MTSATQLLLNAFLKLILVHYKIDILIGASIKIMRVYAAIETRYSRADRRSLMKLFHGFILNVFYKESQETKGVAINSIFVFSFIPMQLLYFNIYNDFF